MKLKAPIVILGIVCVGLIIWLILQGRAAKDQKTRDHASITYLSNQWTETEAKLMAQSETNSALRTTLQARTAELEKTTTDLGDTRTNLARAEAETKMTKEQLEAAKAEMAKRDARITQLENQNLALDKQAADMKTAITELESQIASTQQKLAKSEGDREFLLKELKRLQAEKAELERRFNDLVVLREQVRKLKEELAIQRRLEWIRQGLYGLPKKGAEMLQGGFTKPGTGTRTNLDLNVEIRRGGPAKILTPTNAPPAPGQNK